MAIPLHEDRASLPPEVQNHHRAFESVIEELEAMIWYHERAAVCNDPELKAILEHNRKEETEHMAMLMEWIRRNFPDADEELRTYLFKNMPITQIEESEAGGEAGGETNPGGTRSSGDLSIRSMKKG